ncbi:MAG: hypothetical protein ABRQ39_12460 [Candidatus Eremiobacterota bacterium]
MFTYTDDGNLIDWRGETIGSFNTGNWNTVDIKYAGNKIVYIINDNPVEIITPPEYTPTAHDGFRIYSNHICYPVWYDDITVYRLWGVPDFSNDYVQ